jgi:acyl-coenzyme A synthetase/AMP-(fatty) acid ligase
MVPREVQAVADLPRIGSGKVDRRRLEQLHDAPAREARGT